MAESDAPAVDASKEEKIEYVNDLWKRVFEHSGMDINKEYPISEMERAFLQFDEDNQTNSSYSFLIAMKGGKFDKYPDVWNRIYDSVFDLADNEDVTTPEPPQNPMEDIEWPDPVDPEPEPTPVVPEPTEPTPVEPEPAEPTAEPEPVVEPTADPEPVIEPVADPEPVVEPIPVVEPEQVEDLITIDDEDIPLTDIPDEPVPQTGDSLVWHFASAAAAIALAAVSFLNRKKNQNA